MYQLAPFSKQELRNSELLVVSCVLPLGWCMFGTVALFGSRDKRGKT